MHVTIATPMYGGQCSGLFAKSLLFEVTKLISSGINVSFIDLYNESLITRARDTLTHKFLGTDSDYLLFIDADQSFLASDIIRMINHDKDIIAGVVPMKGINWQSVRNAAINEKANLAEYSGYYNINLIPGAKTNDIPISEPLEVVYAGSGMMLIKRSVFEAISDQVDEYVYDGSSLLDFNIIQGQTKIKNYWNTKIVDGRLLSEDYNFCKMWSNTGGKVFVDLLTKVVHVGTYLFNGSFVQKDSIRSVSEEQTDTAKADKKPATKKK